MKVNNAGVAGVILGGLAISFGLLVGMALFGCAARNLAPVPKYAKPEVIFMQGSDPVPAQMVEHVIGRTGKFCRDSGRPGVKRLILNYKAKDQALAVAYLCNGDSAGVGEEGDSTLPHVPPMKIEMREAFHLFTYTTFKGVAVGL